MFYFPESTECERYIDKSNIYKLVNKGIPTSDDNIVDDVMIENIIDNTTTNLKSNEEFPSILVITIYVKDYQIPKEFLQCLDKYIETPVIYKLMDPEWASDEADGNFIIPIKRKTRSGYETIRVLSSGWQADGGFGVDALKFCKTIEDCYRGMIECFTYAKFDDNESIDSFIKRVCDEYENLDNIEESDDKSSKKSHYTDKGFKTYSSLKTHVKCLSDKKIKFIELRSKYFKEKQSFLRDNGKIRHNYVEDYSQGAFLGKFRFSTKIPSMGKVNEFNYDKKINELHKLLDQLEEFRQYSPREQLLNIEERELIESKLRKAEYDLIFFNSSKYVIFHTDRNEINYYRDVKDNDLLSEIISNGCNIQCHTICNGDGSKLYVYDFYPIQTSQETLEKKEEKIKNEKKEPKVRKTRKKTKESNVVRRQMTPEEYELYFKDKKY